MCYTYDMQERKLKDGRKKQRKAVRITKAVLVAAVLVFAAAAVLLCYYLFQYRKGADEYEMLKAQAVTGLSSQGSTDQESTDQTEINFEFLKEENPDCIAWICFEDQGIDYPVLQGTDNDYYLTHTFEKETVTAASIFMDYRNMPDFTDYNTFIYGHNMKDGSMFGNLRQYEEQEYYEGHPEFEIYTPEGEYTYRIFSAYRADTKEQTDAFRTDFSGQEEFAEYLEQIQRYSLYETGVEVTAEDQIVTLQTCSRAGQKYRLLVHGVLEQKSVKSHRRY